MKALLVGCGSAGKRHLKNLISCKEINYIFVHTRNSVAVEEFRGEKKISFVDSLDEVDADFAIIANETHMHIPVALKLANRKMHLFIEKPLSNMLSEEIKLLEETAKKFHIKVTVGYNLRFLGSVGYIKLILSEGRLGDIYFARIEVGQYLPDWRPGRDYRNSYSAFKSRGGGVSLDLSHEIDIMRNLFGDPDSFKMVKAKISNLQIDADDIFEGIYLYENFICTVHMDYLRKSIQRFILIEGNKGSLFCDQVNKKLTLDTESKTEVLEDSVMFDIDATYIKEIKCFINAIRDDAEPEVTIIDGIRALELVGCVNV